MIQLQEAEPPFERFSNRSSHREVRDKVAVHDVHVQHCRPGRLDALDLIPQTGKVSREYGRDDLKHVPSSPRVRVFPSKLGEHNRFRNCSLNGAAYPDGNDPVICKEPGHPCTTTPALPPFRKPSKFYHAQST